MERKGRGNHEGCVGLYLNRKSRTDEERKAGGKEEGGMYLGKEAARENQESEPEERIISQPAELKPKPLLAAHVVSGLCFTFVWLLL